MRLPWHSYKDPLNVSDMIALADYLRRITMGPWSDHLTMAADVLEAEAGVALFEEARREARSEARSELP